MYAPRSLRLVVVSGAGYASHSLTLGTSITLGRSQCDVMIDDPSVSRRHARLTVGPRGTLAILDLDSANGTTVRGRLLEPNQRTSVSLGEAIALGQAIVLVQNEGTAQEPTEVLARAQLVARLDDRCRDAAETNLPFEVAVLATQDELTDADLLATIGDLLGGSDLIGALALREWAVVIDDVPAGRARRVLKKIVETFETESRAITIGSVAWPAQRTSAALLDAATAGTAVPLGAPMTAMHELADRVASSSLSVLIVGETGVGKEILATRIHQHSPRAGRPFLKLNCAAISPALLESELFGHLRGAFTGADRDKQGLLVAADGGTAFLDEIGELTLDMQARLLRVFEDREVRPVGATESRRIDVRFIAASNRQLSDPATFRPELYFRIAGTVIEVPPLRERADEVLPLARHFLQAYAERHGSPSVLSSGTERVLTTYGWPGNVRELKNAIESAAVMASGEQVIEPHHFPIAEMHGVTIAKPTNVLHEGPTQVGSKIPDRAVIVATLAGHGGNQHLAAEQLGINRRTLMRWMDRLQIARPRKG